LPPEERRQRAIENAYLFPETSADLGLDLAFAEGPRTGSSRTVDLVLHVPVERLLFLPGKDSAVARFTVGFVAIDEGRRKTLAPSGAAPTGKPEGDAGFAGLDVYCRARLPGSGQEIPPVLADEQSGVSGGVRGRLAGAPPGTAAALGLSL